MNFDSPGTDGPPLREILHGSEEGYIPEAAKRGQLTNRISAKAKVRGQSMSRSYEEADVDLQRRDRHLAKQ